MSLQVQTAEWKVPEDGGLVDKATINRILAGDDYPETSGYKQKIESVDFTSHGQPYTQVVVSLVPDNPRMHQGRKLVVVGGEPGSEYAMDFLETPEGKEGPGVWLAKRGITFIGLTRVGRWNFFDKSGNGSWESIPLEQRMPIFHRGQKAPWTEADFRTEATGSRKAVSGDSRVYRFPKEDSPLYDQRPWAACGCATSSPATSTSADG
jgi:hypothetical protein